MNANIFEVGQILELKKEHPCGSKQWKVVKTGIDYKLECVGCNRVVIVPRVELKKKVKKVIQ